MGHTRVVVKGGNEPAMRALLQRVRDMWTHETITVESPAYEPQANGLAERCVQIVNGMVSTARSALEARITRQIPDDIASSHG